MFPTPIARPAVRTVQPPRRRANRARAPFLAGALLLLLAQFPSAAAASANGPVTIVNESASSDGLAVTVTSVYFDAGVSYIAFDIAPSTEIRAAFDHLTVANFRLTAQFGREPDYDPITAYVTWCSQVSPTGTEPVHCVMMQPSFAEPAGVDRIDVTWLVDTIWLQRGEGLTQVQAAWKIEFSAPYDHWVRGPGIFLIMCQISNTPCGPFGRS